MLTSRPVLRACVGSTGLAFTTALSRHNAASPRAMNVPLSLLLLLLLSLTSGPGLARRCAADVLVSGIEDVANTSLAGQETVTPLLLYVRPEPGFKGVSLRLADPGDGGEQYSAWFPLAATCFPASGGGGGKWWRVAARAWLAGQGSSTAHLTLSVHAGVCGATCLADAAAGHVSARLHVRSHGASAWRFATPDAAACLSTATHPSPASPPSPFPACSTFQPLSRAAPIRNPQVTSSSRASGVLLLVMALAVAVLVVVWMWRRCVKMRQQALEEAAGAREAA